MDNFFELVEHMGRRGYSLFSQFFAYMEEVLLPLEINLAWFTLIIRMAFPLLAIIIFLRCVLPLLQDARYSTVWGYLTLNDGTSLPLKHWENSIGRGNTSDLVLNYPYISRNHAVLFFRRGKVFISDLGSKNGVAINRKKVEKTAPVNSGDVISFGGVEAEANINEQPAAKAASKGSHKVPSKLASRGRRIHSGTTFFLIILFQILGSFQVWLSAGFALEPGILQAFMGFILAEWVFIAFLRWHSRRYIELELLGLFLSGLSLLVVASVTPEALFIQLISIIIGMAVYVGLKLSIQNLERANVLKKVFMGIALVLLVLTLIWGETRHGAQRWLDLGFISFQPSELVKIALVMAGAATLDRLLTTRNMTAFIGFAGICIVSFVLMRDFGTVVVFFGAFIVIAFMRSGDWRSIALVGAGGLLGVITVASFMPYITARFAVWGKVWEHAHSLGYQQTQTMIATASGGLLGVGGGNGHLGRIAAADTDLVFGILSEEWGVLVAVCSILILAFCGVYALFLIKNARSSFYAIASCGAAAIILIQTTLNVLGSLDLLPLTGITIPFISRGGTSMIASWGLLALIKSADHRSRPFAKQIPKQRGS